MFCLTNLSAFFKSSAATIPTVVVVILVVVVVIVVVVVVVVVVVAVVGFVASVGVVLFPSNRSCPNTVPLLEFRNKLKSPNKVDHFLRNLI